MNSVSDDALIRNFSCSCALGDVLRTTRSKERLPNCRLRNCGVQWLLTDAGLLSTYFARLHEYHKSTRKVVSKQPNENFHYLLAYLFSRWLCTCHLSKGSYADIQYYFNKAPSSFSTSVSNFLLALHRFIHAYLFGGVNFTYYVSFSSAANLPSLIFFHKDTIRIAQVISYSAVHALSSLSWAFISSTHLGYLTHHSSLRN